MASRRGARFVERVDPYSTPPVTYLVPASGQDQILVNVATLELAEHFGWGNRTGAFLDAIAQQRKLVHARQPV